MILVAVLVALLCQHGFAGECVDVYEVVSAPRSLDRRCVPVCARGDCIRESVLAWDYLVSVRYWFLDSEQKTDRTQRPTQWLIGYESEICFV